MEKHLTAINSSTGQPYTLGKTEIANAVTCLNAERAVTPSTSNVSDLLQWGSNVRHDQIWLRKAGNNLEVSVIGTGDKAIVKDWYVGSSRRVEQIWANGKVLTDAKVQSLVDAMAAFSPPSAGQTTLPAGYQTALNPVIVANWQ
ncbi:calcium-binding protein [Acidovorax sp. FJL06]|uniref:calcium-binding protein n=1 Tax=Acidovorax sp. FJL06 TaxID=2153365 RepID=UPI000F566E21|nr:calcium-binding protein [Acidovorax sp. FJL06]RQO81545.1 hypothetical protein DBV10_14115 [Acidovorax sp. FJL06]